MAEELVATIDISLIASPCSTHGRRTGEWRAFRLLIAIHGGAPVTELGTTRGCLLVLVARVEPTLDWRAWTPAGFVPTRMRMPTTSAVLRVRRDVAGRDGIPRTGRLHVCELVRF